LGWDVVRVSPACARWRMGMRWVGTLCACHLPCARWRAGSSVCTASCARARRRPRLVRPFRFSRNSRNRRTATRSPLPLPFGLLSALPPFRGRFRPPPRAAYTPSRAGPGDLSDHSPVFRFSLQVARGTGGAEKCAKLEVERGGPGRNRAATGRAPGSPRTGGKQKEMPRRDRLARSGRLRMGLLALGFARNMYAAGEHVIAHESTPRAHTRNV
jgi:hypothetical protein